MTSLVKKTSLSAALVRDSSKTTVSLSDSETLMICIDVSGSMRDAMTDDGKPSTKIQVAISSARGLVNASGILSHIGAVAFHSFVDEVISPDTKRSALIERLGNFAKYEGGTAFAPAIMASVKAIRNHQWGAIKRIIFMSDGEDMDQSLPQAIAECANAKIIVDTVMFGSSAEGEETLRRMSSKTGGVFCLAKDAASLRRTFLSLEAGARGLLASGKK